MKNYWNTIYFNSGFGIVFVFFTILCLSTARIIIGISFLLIIFCITKEIYDRHHIIKKR